MTPQTISHKDETHLLQIINRRLPPDEQKRYVELSDKLELEELIEAEHQELLALIQRIEDQNVKRAEAMIELARLRGAPPATVFHEFAPT